MTKLWAHFVKELLRFIQEEWLHWLLWDLKNISGGPYFWLCICSEICWPVLMSSLIFTWLFSFVYRDVKLTQTRQFRSAVLGSSSSDNEKPSSSKGRKKVNKKSGPSVMVSRVDVEEALVDLQLRQPNCRVRMCETEEEFAELLAMFTKAVGEAPFK